MTVTWASFEERAETCGHSWLTSQSNQPPAGDTPWLKGGPCAADNMTMRKVCCPRSTRLFQAQQRAAGWGRLPPPAGLGQTCRLSHLLPKSLGSQTGFMWSSQLPVPMRDGHHCGDGRLRAHLPLPRAKRGPGRIGG